MDGLVLFILLLVGIMVGPPVVLIIVGLIKRKTNKDSAKIFYILAVAWVVIGGGICASMMM